MGGKRVEPRTYSRQKRKNQILTVFKIAAQHDDCEPKTIADVGRLIGLNRSTHLQGILHEMSEEGELVESWRDVEGKMGAYVFTLSSTNYHELLSRRKIAVKNRGVVVGQMEMFS